MYKLKDYLKQLQNKKVLYGSYRQIGTQLNMTFQNSHYLITGRKMDTFETYSQLDRLFGCEFTFVDYAKGVSEALTNSELSDKFVAEYVGITEIHVKSIRECKGVCYRQNYERLEDLLDGKLDDRIVTGIKKPRKVKNENSR